MLVQDHSSTVFLKITIHSHIKHYYDGYYSKNLSRRQECNKL